jgi:hypothetical protein
MDDKRDTQVGVILRLSGVFGDMRDALSRLALSLREYQFEQDSVQRQLTARNVSGSKTVSIPLKFLRKQFHAA